MTDETMSLPAIEDGDSDDVRWGLETANTLWAQGEHRAALRWLSRAAETAASEENDRRSLTLARAAADIRARLNLTSSLVPAGAAPQSAPASSAAAVLTRPAATPAGSAAAAPMTPAKGADLVEPPKPERTLTGLDKAEAGDDERPPDSERRFRPGGSTHVAVRVAVGGGLSNDGSLRVRRLADGEVTRDGEHLAMLVSLETDFDLSLL